MNPFAESELASKLVASDRLPFYMVFGTINAITGTTVSVNFRGSTEVVENIPVFSHYTPVVSETVAIIIRGNEAIVLGRPYS